MKMSDGNERLEALEYRARPRVGPFVSIGYPFGTEALESQDLGMLLR